MKHVFRATRIGWGNKQDGIWFDADELIREEAEAEFKPFQGTTQKGFPYTGYEFGGVKYHDVYYLGVYEDDKIPKNNDEFIDSLFERLKKEREGNQGTD